MIPSRQLAPGPDSITLEQAPQPQATEVATIDTRHTHFITDWAWGDHPADERKHAHLPVCNVEQP